MGDGPKSQDSRKPGVGPASRRRPAGAGDILPQDAKEQCWITPYYVSQAVRHSVAVTCLQGQCRLNCSKINAKIGMLNCSKQMYSTTDKEGKQLAYTNRE